MTLLILFTKSMLIYPLVTLAIDCVLAERHGYNIIDLSAEEMGLASTIGCVASFFFIYIST